MPLINSKSKKAFKKNLETEMDAGKPQKQSLAIAFNIQRKSKKKKMASGGPVEVDFVSEGKETADTSRTPEEMEMLKNKRPKSPGDVDVTANEESYETADTASTLEDLDMIKKKKQSLPGEYSGSGADARKMLAKGGYLTNAKYEEHATADNADTDEDLDMYHDYPRESHPEATNFHDERRSDIDDAATSEEMDMIDQIRHKMKYAQGGEIEEGQVDIDENGEEQPNSYYARNEHAALKENYDKDMDHVHSPMDSGQHGDDIPHDEHDMIDLIRRKMKASRGY